MTQLSKAFWDQNARFLKVDENSGRVFFSAEGKDHYGPLLARHGTLLESIKTIEQFKSVMRDIQMRKLSENDDKLKAILDNPRAPLSERKIAAKLLGEPEPCESPKAGEVIELKAWKKAAA